MKVRNGVIVLLFLAAVLMTCILPLDAQVVPKVVEITPGTTVQWPTKTTVVVTTTVSQSIKTADLLRQKQKLFDRIGRLQGEVSRLQAEVTYIDLILASYADPNESS